jgi:hypothetical protein
MQACQNIPIIAKFTCTHRACRRQSLQTCAYMRIAGLEPQHQQDHTAALPPTAMRALLMTVALSAYWFSLVGQSSAQSPAAAPAAMQC